MDLYSVERDENGKNLIHVLGYFYQVEGEYRGVEYAGLFLDPNEYRLSGFDYYDSMQEQTKQYVGEYSKDEIEFVIAECFKDVKFLSMMAVYDDTSEGFYCCDFS